MFFENVLNEDSSLMSCGRVFPFPNTQLEQEKFCTIVSDILVKNSFENISLYSI